MLWKGREQSANVEDRRGLSDGKVAVSGGVGILVGAAVRYVVPDAFTHDTSEQRKNAFLRGFRTGDLKQGGIDLARAAP